MAVVLARDVRFDAPVLGYLDFGADLIEFAVPGAEARIVKDLGLDIGNDHHASQVELPLDSDAEARTLGKLAAKVAQVKAAPIDQPDLLRQRYAPRQLGDGTALRGAEAAVVGATQMQVADTRPQIAIARPVGFAQAGAKYRLQCHIQVHAKLVVGSVCRLVPGAVPEQVGPREVRGLDKGVDLGNECARVIRCPSWPGQR